MGTFAARQLVTVATAGPEIDGIVHDVPSDSKLVVAVVDRTRGPVLRTVATDSVSERETAGPSDAALEALIRRSPNTSRGSGQGGGGGGVGGRAGHARSTGHRTTGK